jgi:hypothetical protein
MNNKVSPNVGVKKQVTAQFGGLRNIRFTWDDKKNVFITPENKMIALPVKTTQVVTDTVQKIETESGIRKPSLCIRNLVFIAIVLGGFTISFFLILAGWGKTGFFVIVLTVFCSYFLTLGRSMIQ